MIVRQMRHLMLVITMMMAVASSAFADKPMSPVTIENAKGGKAVISVEWALSEAERVQGLMNRRFLDPDHGMMFDFKSEQQISMWMKNTYIPLDMLFIDKTGIIRAIARGAVPLSEDHIGSPFLVRYVLEVNAGTAERFDIHPGDHVRW